MKADPNRFENIRCTGILVHAEQENGRYGATDLSHLDESSINKFLDDKNHNWLKRTILIMLGHPQ